MYLGLGLRVVMLAKRQCCGLQAEQSERCEVEEDTRIELRWVKAKEVFILIMTDVWDGANEPRALVLAESQVPRLLLRCT